LVVEVKSDCSVPLTPQAITARRKNQDTRNLLQVQKFDNFYKQRYIAPQEQPALF
jgi:hypothetical protein